MDDSLWSADGFRLNYFRIQPTVRWETEKTLTILASILLTTSFFYYLIWYQFRGYGAMKRILRNEVPTPLRYTNENHYNFVVVKPLVKSKVVLQKCFNVPEFILDLSNLAQLCKKLIFNFYFYMSMGFLLRIYYKIRKISC